MDKDLAALLICAPICACFIVLSKEFVFYKFDNVYGLLTGGKILAMEEFVDKQVHAETLLPHH